MPTRDQFTDGESFLKALRDWFAGQALAGLLCRSWDHLGKDANIIKAWADSAYAVADELIKSEYWSVPDWIERSQPQLDGVFNTYAAAERALAA